MSLTKIKGIVSPSASEVFLDNGTSVEDAIGSGGGATGTSTATIGELFEFGDIQSSGFPGMIIPNNSRFIFNKTTAVDDQAGTTQISTVHNNTGGTSGFVSSGLLLRNTVNNSGNNYVWGLNGILDNYADAGEQVCLSGSSFRKGGTGPLWAGHFQAVDETGESNEGKGGLVGIEVNVNCNNSSGTNNNRIIGDFLGKKNPAAVEDPVIAWGVRSRMQPDGAGGYEGSLGVAFQADGGNIDFLSSSTDVGTNSRAFKAEGSYAVGIDLGAGTYSRSAIRMLSGQQISFNETDAYNVRLDSSSITLNNDGDGGVTPSQKYIFDMNRSAPTAPVMNAYIGNPGFAETVSTTDNAASFASAQIEDTPEISVTYASDSTFTLSGNVKRARVSWNFAESSSASVSTNHTISVISPSVNWRAYGAPVIRNVVSAGASATGELSTILENTTGTSQSFQLVREASSSTTLTTAPLGNNNVVRIEVLEWA